MHFRSIYSSFSIQSSLCIPNGVYDRKAGELTSGVQCRGSAGQLKVVWPTGLVAYRNLKEMPRRECSCSHWTEISCFSLILMYFKECLAFHRIRCAIWGGIKCLILLPSQRLYPVNKLQVKCQALTKFCLVVLCNLVSLIYGLVGRTSFLPSKALLEKHILFQVMGGLKQSKSCVKKLYHFLFCSVRSQEAQHVVRTESQWQGNLQGWEMCLIFSKCNCDQLFYMELRPGKTHLIAFHFSLGWPSNRLAMPQIGEVFLEL